MCKVTVKKKFPSEVGPALRRRKPHGETFPGHAVRTGSFPETNAKAGLWAAAALVQLYHSPRPLPQPHSLVWVCLCVCVCVQAGTSQKLCFCVLHLKSHQGSCCLEARELNSSHSSVIWPDYLCQFTSPLWASISSFVNADDTIWTN